MYKQLSDLAETINGNFVSTIAEAAKKNKIQVIGSLLIMYWSRACGLKNV